jgi:Flp pilus assembly protein CpaB
MKPARIAVICIAAVAAIGLALVVRAMGSSSGEPAAVAEAAEPARPMAKVLVAARDLAPGQRLTDADLEKITSTYHLWRGDPHPTSGHPLPVGEGRGEGLKISLKSTEFTNR